MLLVLLGSALLSLGSATMLTDAIATLKPLPLQRCLSMAKQELNLRALPAECHEDICQFYCQKIHDVASHRYRNTFQSECDQAIPLEKSPNFITRSYKPATIGYVILSHRFAQNVQRLVSRLFEPGATAFVVHVDAKSPDMLQELLQWRQQEELQNALEVFSEFNVVRGGPAMLQAEIRSIQKLLNSSIGWEVCILLSEFDYPLRANSVLMEYLWIHSGTSFVSIDEGECERDVSYQCGDRVVSLSGGSQYPKIPGLRYGSGSQWVTLARDLAAEVARDVDRPSTTVGTIYRDLVGVKQPDESFFQAVILNSRFCHRYSDYTLHWTDKGSMKEVRSVTSEYNILSPGVLQSESDYFKLAGVRSQSLWAFFARKFDDGRASTEMKNRLDQASSSSAQEHWEGLQHPALSRIVQVLISSLAEVDAAQRLDRNKDGLFGLQMMRLVLRGSEGKSWMIREKLSLPKEPGPVLALRVGCGWNKTELVFEEGTSLVPAAESGPVSCESLWAVVHWRMSRRPITQELVLVWVDPRGTPMQHAPLAVTEHSVLAWHRFTATRPLPVGRWTLEVMTPTREVLARRSFFAFQAPNDIPWEEVETHFEVLHEQGQDFDL